MIKLVLTDLDDTLIPFGAPCASERAVTAIHGLLDAGLHFGPVSGRVPGAMGWMFGRDERCFATGAFGNGQIVRIDGEVVREVASDSAYLRQVVDTLEELDHDAWLTTYSLDPRDGVTFVTSREGRLRARLSAEGYPYPYRVTRDFERPSYLKSNVRCACPREQMVLIRDLLRERVPELHFVFPSMIAPYIDISPAHWDKGAAVRLIAKELGVGIDEVATFGDSENDLPMIEVVPNSVAVANADAPVSAAARWHIGEAKDDAVAAALEEIAAASAAGCFPPFMS